MDKVDPGLITLVILLRYHGVSTEPNQIRHQCGTAAIGVAEMLRCAKELGLKARVLRTGWARLSRTPLPGIAGLHSGGFRSWGRQARSKILVQNPLSPRPEVLSRAEFEAVWDGSLVLMARRTSISDLSRRFDVTWFLGAMHKYRWLLGEFWFASFFLQIFALVTPLFFQVIIDKVLVHRSLSTLEVLVVGLVAISVFEAILERFAPTYSPIPQSDRRRTRGSAVSPPCCAADCLLSGPTGRRLNRSRA